MRVGVILLLACLATFTWADDAKAVIDDVKEGIDAGKALTDIFSTADKTFGIITKFSKAIGPYLGAIGPAISIISIFIPTGPSPELLFMKEKFAEMDAKFDQVFNKLDDLERLFEEKAIKAQYGEYEHDIVALNEILTMYLSAPENYTEILKTQFIRNYEAYYDNAALKLYNGVMGKHSFTDDIASSVMKYTKYDRYEFQRIMKSLLFVIVQGVKVHLAYINIKGDDDTYNRQDWEQKLILMETSITEWDTEVKNKWNTQAYIDIEQKLAEYEGKSNSKMADDLYAFLVEKYYWRDWHVLSYNAKKGDKYHMITVCQGTGYRWFDKHGRNLMVASVDSNSALFDRNRVLQQIMNISTYKKSAWSVKKRRSAKDIYNLLPSSYRTGCQYASKGVIDSIKMDIQHRSKNGRLVKTTNRMQIYIFGSR